MSKRIKKHQPEFKLKVVLETYAKGSTSAVARHYGINANQISVWRRILLDKGGLAFQTEVSQKEKRLQERVDQLQSLLGKKELEISLLQQYLDFYAPPSGR